MVSLQGVCPFFDYEFTYPENVVPTPQKIITYPPDSIMSFIEKQSPLFAFLVKKARLDWTFASPENRITIFLPLHLNEQNVMNADINTARRIVKYHLMMGFFPRNVLETSPYQQLTSSIKGETILARLDRLGMILNDRSRVIEWDLSFFNGFIHLIDNPLLS